MSITSMTTESIPVRAKSGCGTLESPWMGWEDQLETPGAQFRHHVFDAGFWGVTRAVRLPGGSTLTAAPNSGGRPWFLPMERVDTLFRIDGVHEVTLSGLCLNGRGSRATHGVYVRCGTAIQVDTCAFGDFAHDAGAALRIDGESAERFVREVVIHGCRFVNGTVAVKLDRHVSDLLINDNRIEEFRGPALQVDPRDDWFDYGLIFVKNRISASAPDRQGPFLSIRPGAEGIRLADNDFSGPDDGREATGKEWAAIHVRGGGMRGRRRIELLSNRVVGVAGPAIEARQCGPGFLVAGNHAVACGTLAKAVIDLAGCQGALLEDNEIAEATGAAIRVTDCAGSRVNGNEIHGLSDATAPRGGSTGVLVEGTGARLVRITDNRIFGVRDPGILVAGGVGLRVVGNEVQDCGEGIRVTAGRNLVLVGNDCRDNGAGGIRVDAPVHRGVVALNYAILNGPVDLEVLGQRIACRRNKVDRTGTVPGSNGAPEPNGNPA